MTSVGFTFDLLTVVLMAGVIAMVVSTTLMVVDMMPSRRRGQRGEAAEPTGRRLSPAAARLVAQARERAALNSADPAVITSQLGLDAPTRPSPGDEMTLLVPPSAPGTIVLPPGSVSMAPRPTEPQLALPAGPSPEAIDLRVPPVVGPVIDVPFVPTANDRLSFYEASNLAQHLALNDPDRIVDVIKQWLQNDTRVYEEDV